MTNRREFIYRAGQTMMAARLGLIGTGSVARETGSGYAAAAAPRQSRELRALTNAAEWINSTRMTPEDLAGRVIAIDFCTYSCINWLRALPYRRAWSSKYGARLTLIGVHTPEFSFEHDIAGVQRAVERLRIDYPVVIDNDYAIWRAFRNHYWPALYFIDARGRVRDHHFGEGEYERSERVIQRLIAAAGGEVSRDIVAPVSGGVEAAPDWASLRSPENYLGATRTRHFASRGGVSRNRGRRYELPTRMDLNEWGLEGQWTIGAEAIALNAATGRLSTRFHARDLHLVMRPSHRDVPVRFRVSLDGRPPGFARGSDVSAAGDGVVTEPRLYQLIRQQRPIDERQFEIEFLEGGLEAFALTFG